MNETLTVSLIHLNVRYKEPEVNRKRLVELNRQAAGHSRIIVNTEMAVSGYSFQSLSDVADYVEPDKGPTLTAMKEIAKESGAYIVIGFAEADENTGMYYNAAHVVGPDGDTVCRYRKINAEARWACPGQGTQNNTFDTPWGRVGVLICSDSYYGLMPRQTALRGATLILVPANWPVSGMDPRNIWKARAMENGVFVAACNRGGTDRIMSCESAWSCAYTPQGTESLTLIDSGPLRVGICHEEDLRHPETAVGASKLGCDLLLSSAGTLDSSAPLLFGVKSIEQTALAVAGTNMAFICEPPKGHDPWREEIITKQGVCSMDLDSSRTRNKRFQDRVDFEVLLQRN